MLHPQAAEHCGSWAENRGGFGAHTTPRQRGTAPYIQVCYFQLYEPPRLGLPRPRRYRKRPIWRRCAADVIGKHLTVNEGQYQKRIKGRELSTTKPGNIAACWELSTTAKTSQNTRKTTPKYKLRDHCGLPLRVTMENASGRAHGARSSLGKTGLPGNGGRARTSSKKLILKI